MFSHILSDAVRFIVLHPNVVRAAIAVLIGACAIVMLYLCQAAVKDERWAWYFGLAFLIHATEYGLLLGLTYPTKHWRDWWDLQRLLEMIAVFGSCGTNLLLLGAARELLGYKKILPWWSFGMASLFIAMVISGNSDSWDRLPETAFSFYCLTSMGYAAFTNIGPRLRPSLSLSALAIALSGAAIQIAYGLNPLLVTDGEAAINLLWPGYTITNDPQVALKSMDTLIIALMLPLRLGLFFVAFYLLMQAMMVVSSNDAKKVLRGLIEGNQEYLPGGGIISSIGEITGADEVTMSLLLPGWGNELAAPYRWNNRTGPISTSTPILLLPDKKRIAEIVIKDGVEIIYSNRVEAWNQLQTEIEDLDPRSSIVAAPVKFHGAVIGCLSVEWKDGGLFTNTAIKQIRNFADLISPIAQSRREIAALDQLCFRFTRWQVEKNPIDDNRGAIRDVTDILHDITSPLVTIITINFGFQALGCLRRKHGPSEVLSQTTITDEFAIEAGVRAGGTMEVEVIKESLVVKKVDENGYKLPPLPIGGLVFVVPSERDDLTHPTLARGYLYRRAARAMVAEELLTISRYHLNAVLKDFVMRLNSRHVDNLSEWFYELWRTANAAGLPWAAASQMNDDNLIGSPTWIEVIKGRQLQPQNMGGEPAESTELKLIPLDPPVAETRQIIRLYLPETKTWVWLGIVRKEFGPELEFHSPWKEFLERFAEIADSSSVRLMAAIEFHRLQILTAQAQGLATVAVTTGTLHHQLTNLVRDLANPISTLNEALQVGKLKADGHLGEIIVSMKESAGHLLGLASEMMNVTKIDDHRPCKLLEAVKESKTLFGIALRQGEIELEVVVASDLEVDVPFHVASLAIANLVSNAKDAFLLGETKSTVTIAVQREQITQMVGDGFFSVEAKDSIERVKRFIRIEAQDQGDMIHCQVTDNGPGVKPQLRDRIFNLGATTKPGSGGWGLYLAKRSLQENRGYLDLTRTGPEGTQFTIRFPKPRLEI
ncbi:MAG TPA: GAF domain-containing sensor histidine kinase [Blastocatellia bacterium]|nr:GAF domain-containing sensor histidine kinase [Blastocatellia bacterium]